jgi:UDP-GlcNAc:undecaprenyl-phosphate/decaprenyl-phosphate GlcNAc-1-phosphate transferase
VIITPLLASLLPAVLTFAVIQFLRRSPWSERLADHPNERSLHAVPIPRVGGVAIMLASLPIALLTGGEALILYWALALALSLVSFADDLRSLPIPVRLAAHFACAGLVVAAAYAHGAFGISVAVILILSIAWMTNLFNFMDGSDGLAGGMAAIGFGAYAIAAHQAQQPALALGCTALASGACGFLLFNFPPARVFMGDAGSIPLGFLAGALGMHGALLDAWPWWFGPLVFSPFIVDASVTIARRLACREKIWIAHRSHFYQRLVLSGWSRRKLAALLLAIATAVSASAIGARTQGYEIQCAILVAWVVFYAIALLAVQRHGTARSASP